MRQPNDRINHGLVDERGNPVGSRPVVFPSNREKDVHSSKQTGLPTLGDLRTNVGLLNGAAALFLTGMVSLFLWMLDRIDDKTSAIQSEIGEIETGVVRNSAKLENVEKEVDRLEAKALPANSSNR